MTEPQNKSEWTCQNCGGNGDKFEVIDNSGGETTDQAWVYCKQCDTETFYDLEDE